MLGAHEEKSERGRKGRHDNASAQRVAPFGVACHHRKDGDRVTGGTAVFSPIQNASIPTAFSHTVKNGKWVPVMPNKVPQNNARRPANRRDAA